MKTDLYTASVPVFDRGLNGLAAVLRKGAAHAEARGMAEADVVQARLTPDMFPLFRQVQIVCDFARHAPARLAGLDAPPALEGMPGLGDMQHHIADAKQFLGGLSPAQFEGRDDVAITFPVGDNDMTLPAAQYLLGFALQNYFFHFVTAYDILRHLGVDLGKRDYFGM